MASDEKRLTIRDIARMANVSRSTVSLALNNSPLVKAETRARIMQLIEDVGYRPNAMARGLVSKHSGVISVVVPPMGHVFSDAYFSECLSGILDAAAEADYRVAIEIANERFTSGKRPEELFEERRTDGLLAVGSLIGDAYLERLHEKGRSVVLVNSELGDVPAVVADNEEGVVSVVHHLVSLGHRAIGYIKGLDITTVGLQRDRGFLKGLRLTGLAFSEALAARGDFTEQSGYEAMGRILERGPAPTALFAANDMMAIGAARCLRERGFAVGRDVALVGGDDAPLARYVEPPLTTLRQSMYDLGAAAARLLLEWLRAGQAPARRTILHTELIVRASCGAARSRSANTFPEGNTR